jgi:hypothetical protein
MLMNDIITIGVALNKAVVQQMTPDHGIDEDNLTVDYLDDLSEQDLRLMVIHFEDEVGIKVETLDIMENAWMWLVVERHNNEEAAAISNGCIGLM